LNKRVFVQKEKILIDEKEKTDLRLKLQQEFLESKQRELTLSVLHLETKNELLLALKKSINDLQTTDRETNAKLKLLTRQVDNSLEADNDFDKFRIHFEKVHPSFFSRLQAKAVGGLSTLDMKYCAFMRMQLDTKEIANLLNIEPASIRTAKYRLRQKLNLEKDEDLQEYLLRI
jgi:DNA-binding CsgD family transcriptional regulator